ncbi:MAG: hypothetical protein WDW38_007533 [Sanguina aurantia]
MYTPLWSQGYNNGGYGGGGGGGSSSAQASAEASASSQSFGGGGGGYNRGDNYYRKPYYGGGGGYDQGKKLLSIPSIQDFMSAMGFAGAASAKDVPMPQPMFGAHPDKIVEMPDHYEVLVLIPGFTSQDQVAAEIQHGILMLNGQKGKLTGTGPDEREGLPSSGASSAFAHSLAVPHNIKAHLMTTHVSDAGVVTVKLPKQ